METLTMMTMAAAGLAFSISVALLIEELLFGAIFRLLFGQMRSKSVVKAAAGSSRTGK